jgi:hypothetical protein
VIPGYLLPLEASCIWGSPERQNRAVGRCARLCRLALVKRLNALSEMVVTCEGL